MATDRKSRGPEPEVTGTGSRCPYYCMVVKPQSRAPEVDWRPPCCSERSPGCH